MIHYHGLPITPETAAAVALQGGHGFVSFAEPRNLGLAAAVCQSFAIENGEQLIYSLELQHKDMVRVEHIKTACALHREGFQEAVAAGLHARFGGRLLLRAKHHGVEIETVLGSTAGIHIMSQNTTAMQRGGMLAKHQIASQKRQANAAGIVKIDKPNRAQRRAAKKQKQEQLI